MPRDINGQNLLDNFFNLLILGSLVAEINELAKFNNLYTTKYNPGVLYGNYTKPTLLIF